MDGFTLACVLTSAAELARLDTVLLQLISVLLVHKGIVACFLSAEAMLLSLANTGYVPGIQSVVEQSAGEYKK